MIQKKICLLGAFAVGKTSLIQQFVNSIFSEKYHTTLGVKIDKKIININDTDLKLMLWDLAGEDEFMEVRMSYLRGSSGLLFVADGTRRETLDVVIKLDAKVKSNYGDIPSILLINKSDLEDQWQLNEQKIRDLSARGWVIFKTSAKSGDHVEDAFNSLAILMLDGANE